MIGEALNLTRWEWFKLRHRRLPWILLAVSVLLLQVAYWGAYAVFRFGEDLTFGAGGRVSVGGEFQEVLAFPNSAGIGLTFSHGFSVILIMTLAVSLTGTEYGWGTVRAVLTRGAGRWQLLAAKLILVSILGAAALVLGVASLAIGSFVASLTLEGAGWIATSPEWGEVARILGKSVYGLLPYVVLGVFIAVVTTSSGAAIGLGLGYVVAENIVVGILSSFEWFERVSGFILGQAVEGLFESADQTSPDAVFAGQPVALQGFLVSLAYIVILSGLAFWIFLRRDVAGAKGE